jgi:peptidoglycan-associated lipoprotein
LNAEKPLADALFEYDSTDLSAEARAALQKNVEWLKRWNTTRIMVEGHADSRGTTEYNLALGERRAMAAKNYLQSLGISADRLRTVSYGDEYPFDRNHSEDAWSLNRRAHFVISAK